MVVLSGIPLVEGLVALAMVVVVPLGLRLGRTPRGGLSAVWVTGLLAVAALFVEGLSSAALVGPYLLVSTWIALAALRRMLARGVCAESLLDLGQAELPIAAAWLLASRAGWGWGFDEPIVTLTSAHFHYAGFAAATVAGVVLRRVSAPVTGAVVALGPPLVGLGIALSPIVEAVSAITLALGMLGLGVAMVRFDRRLALPALPLVGTMALAVTWALQELVGAQWLVMPQMAQWHGVANAVGFALPSLVLLQWLAPDESRTVPDLSALPDLRPSAGQRPVGLYPSLEPFGLDGVPDEVKAYHLDAQSVVLLVRPTWSSKSLGKLINRVNGWLGNLVLPYEDRVHRVTNRLEPMEPGWVFSTRSWEDGTPMFRLAYGTEGRAMRVVAPLPLGALDALLEGQGTDPHTLGATAIHWVVGPVRVRLPLH